MTLDLPASATIVDDLARALAQTRFDYERIRNDDLSN